MDKHGFGNKFESMIILLEKMGIALEELKKEKSVKRYELFLFAAEKKAEEIVELATTINQELLRTKNKMSTSYYDSFIDLAVFTEFNKQELKTLGSTAGFRNSLAHDYLTVDSKVALQPMESMLTIYPLYLKKVKKIVDALT